MGLYTVFLDSELTKTFLEQGIVTKIPLQTDYRKLLNIVINISDCPNTRK